MTAGSSSDPLDLKARGGYGCMGEVLMISPVQLTSGDISIQTHEAQERERFGRPT